MRKLILLILKQRVSNRFLLFVEVQVRGREYFARVEDYSFLAEVEELLIGCFGVALDGDPHLRCSLLIRSHYNNRACHII